MKKIILSTFGILLTQIVFFLVPTFFFGKSINAYLVYVNAFFTFLLIKYIEIYFYKEKASGPMSMIYNICPFIGISLLAFIVSKLIHDNIIFNYYLSISVYMYLLNIIYLFIREIKGGGN